MLISYGIFKNETLASNRAKRKVVGGKLIYAEAATGGNL